MFCIPKNLADAFKSKIISGEITPQKLHDMDSQARNEYFSGFLGKQNAKQVNALLESKFLLKGWQAGVLRWAKEVAGMKPEVKRDLISRVEKMTKILKPEELKGFYNDLAEKKLGIGVTADEAAKIADLSAKVTETKKAAQNGGDRFKYGWAQVEFYNYFNDLKLESEKMGIGERAKEAVKHPFKSFNELAGFAKSTAGSMDNSSIFRQGWKTLWAHPKIWIQNAPQTFLNIARTLKGVNVIDVVNADILSRPTYRAMQRAKLAVANVEEAFPTTLPEKVPFLGRLYKASQDTYTAFLYKTRADVFDKYLEIWEKSGRNIKDVDELKNIGKLVNSLTGRGHLGAIEPIANVVNNVFFSPRFTKSQFDVLTAHAFDPSMSGFAKKQAAYNLVKIISGSAAILTIANAINPDSVEWDPRSSDFGKIKIGDTRFDVTGGMGSLLVLAARFAKQSTKSTSTGLVKPINTGEWGSMTTGDLFFDFFKNKLSPAYRLATTLRDPKTFSGEPSSIGMEALRTFAPIPITNAIETLKNPNAAPLALVLIADALGISANTYSQKKTDAEKLYDEIEDMTDDEARKKEEFIKSENTVLFKLYEKEKEEQEMGITAQDKYIKQLGVKDYGRAMYIWDEYSSMKNEEEKTAYLNEMKQKKIITEGVWNQLKEIKKAGGYEDLGLEKKDEDQGIISKYAEAFTTDSGTATKALLTGEKLAKTEGGIVSLERTIGEVESNRIKKERGYGSVLDEVKLEHIIPLELGGDNSDDNLMVVTNEKHGSYTPVENLLTKKVKSGSMTKKEAQNIMEDIKVNHTMTAQEILSKYQ